MSSDHIEPAPTVGAPVGAPEGGPRRYHHGDLANALLDAVEASVREDGVEGVSVRGCARRVGVSSSAAFRHFADKRDLMTAFAARGFAALNARVRAGVEAAGPDPAARFRAVGEAYVLFALDRPGTFQAMFRTDLMRSGDPRIRAENAVLEAALVAGLAPLLPPGDGGDAAKLKALLAWGVVHGLAVLATDGQLDDLVPRTGQAPALLAAIGLMRPAFEARTPADAGTGNVPRS